MKKSKKSLIKTRNYVLFVLILLIVVSFTNQLTYARVKYHSLGDDATKIYVKEIRELKLDYKNYDWFWDGDLGYLLGADKKDGTVYLYVDPNSLKVFFNSKDGGAIEFDKERKYMMYYAGGGYVEIYDLKTMKKERYDANKIYDVLDKTSNKYNFEYMYDRYHIIGLEQTGKDEYWISVGDVRTGKVERKCRIKGYEKFNFIKFMDKNNIFYEVEIKNGNKEEKRLYRLSVEGCKSKVILRGFYIIDDVHQFIYRNYKGEIRIRLDYINERVGIADRNGRLVRYLASPKIKIINLCGIKYGSSYAMISPDDKFDLKVLGEVDPYDEDEYWIKGGKRCVYIKDYKGNVSKLDLGLGDREVPDELYWHPMGDRLIMKHKGKISIVILGRR